MLKKTIIIIIFAILTACAHLNHKNQKFISAPKNSLRVASYNVNWENGSHTLKNPQANIQAMIQTQSDILVLQEATDKWIQRIKENEVLDGRYPYIVFKDYPNASGLAVLSKYPFTTTHYSDPNIGWHPKWIFTVNTPYGIVQVVNIHLNPPVIAEGNIGFWGNAIFASRYIRKNEAKFLLAHLNNDVPTILIGDFNENHYGSAVKIFKANGYTDAMSLMHIRSYTWEWQFGVLTFEDSVDRILFNNEIKLLNLQVLYEGESDHYPIIADLQIQ